MVDARRTTSRTATRRRPRSPSPRSPVGSVSPRRRCAPGTVGTGSVRPSTPRVRTAATPPSTSNGCSSCGGSRSTAWRPPSPPGSRSRPTSSPAPSRALAPRRRRPRPPCVDAALAGDVVAAAPALLDARARRRRRCVVDQPGRAGARRARPPHRRRPARGRRRPRRSTRRPSPPCAARPGAARARVGPSSSCSSPRARPARSSRTSLAGALAAQGVDARIVGGPGRAAPRGRARRDDAGRAPSSRSAERRRRRPRGGGPARASEQPDLPQFVMVPDRAARRRPARPVGAPRAVLHRARCTRCSPSRRPASSAWTGCRSPLTESGGDIPRRRRIGGRSPALRAGRFASRLTSRDPAADTTSGAPHGAREGINMAGVVVCHGSAVVRERLVVTSIGVPALGPVRAASSVDELLSLARRMPPTVVLLDAHLGAPGAIEAIRRLRAVAPSAAIVLLALPDDTVALDRALALGARGFLAPDVGRAELSAVAAHVLASPVLPAAAGAAAATVDVPSQGSFRASDLRRRQRRPVVTARATPTLHRVGVPDHGCDRRRPADQARDRGAHRHEPRTVERPDRRRAVPVRGHRQDARAPAVPQARVPTTAPRRSPSGCAGA